MLASELGIFQGIKLWPKANVPEWCNTAHHAEDTSAGLFRLLPGAARPLSPSVPSPSFSPLSQPSSTGPPQGLTLRDRREEGEDRRKSSPWGGVNVTKGVAELGLGGYGGGSGEADGEAIGEMQYGLPVWGGTGLTEKGGGRYSPQR